jgi:4-hydroxybenzoate polyprenyltransferase
MCQTKKGIYKPMRTNKWMSALIFFIPALIAGVGVHSIQEFLVALFLFAIAFTATTIIFYTQS